MFSRTIPRMVPRSTSLGARRLAPVLRLVLGAALRSGSIPPLGGEPTPLLEDGWDPQPLRGRPVIVTKPTPPGHDQAIRFGPEPAEPLRRVTWSGAMATAVARVPRR